MIAMGDGFNDLSMIKFAGLGVAMSNAQDAVKAEANLVTLSNDEHGVAQVIKDYILND
jgi:hydroxymethylpyrimidine pyrophosphatase-like HAD family hydrolase